MKELVPLVENFGGGSSDVSGRYGALEDGRLDHASFYNPLGLLDRLRYFLEHPEVESDLLTEIARVEVAYAEHSTISAVEWVRESLQPKLDRKSKVRRIICESGIWNEGNFVFWKSFCH